MVMRLILAVVLCFPLFSSGQYANFRSKSEVGFMLGGSNYFGDLNQFNPIYGVKPAAGLLYRYSFHSRATFRLNIMYGNVGAADADASQAIKQNRNLSFFTPIYEIGSGVEFHYKPFKLGHSKHFATAYVLAEIALFKMNPQTMYDDEAIELQPLGTEGQGTSLNSDKPYSLTQLSLPIGAGFKISLGKKASFSFEYGLRKTFTDYIDDVGSDTYVDHISLSQQSGPLAATLANQSLDGSRFGKRGDSITKDWYSFFGVMFSFRIGKEGICFGM